LRIGGLGIEAACHRNRFPMTCAGWLRPME
jgi:hypothetical protein